jgi:beta-galactosidase
LYDLLAGWLLAKSGLKPILAAPDGIEVTERWKDGKRLLFVLNHHVDPMEITLDSPFFDLLSSKSLSGNVSLPPREVLILKDLK